MATSAVQACPLRCPAICQEKAKLAQWSAEAAMAEEAYRPAGKREVDGYDEVTAPEDLQKLNLDPDMLTPSDSEFRAAVFRKKGTDDYVVAFKGTSSKVDIWPSLVQGTGNKSDYYTRAQQIARNSSERVGKASVSGVSFTGHSLGGGLASAAARATGRPATTFNAAGLHDKTVTAPKAAPIDAVRVKGEILTAAQTALPIPKAAHAGKPYTLDPPANVGSAMQQSGLSPSDGLAYLFGPKIGTLWNGGKYVKGMAARGVELHKMKAVRDSLEARSKQIRPQAQACGC
ncbi:MAG TPA: hypothetical protein VEL28_18335 [Candidatus Binatia bacterium]|nr:hypothetical protein [Candidatus Binatia bacterium]